VVTRSISSLATWASAGASSARIGFLVGARNVVFGYLFEASNTLPTDLLMARHRGSPAATEAIPCGIPPRDPRLCLRVSIIKPSARLLVGMRPGANDHRTSFAIGRAVVRPCRRPARDSARTPTRLTEFLCTEDGERGCTHHVVSAAMWAFQRHDLPGGCPRGRGSEPCWGDDSEHRKGERQARS
jgi:hypothetical protein